MNLSASQLVGSIPGSESDFDFDLESSSTFAEQLRGESLRNGRRPADVWVPQWQTGRPAAWDFAVTSGLQQGRLFTTLSEPRAALVDKALSPKGVA